MSHTFKLKPRNELSKELRRLDRLRHKSQKSHKKELAELKALDDFNGEFIFRIEATKNYDTLESYNQYLWYCELQTDSKLGDVYLKDPYLARTYNQVELSDVVMQSSVKANYSYKDEFFIEFERIINEIKQNNLRTAIVPIAFNKPTSYGFLDINTSATLSKKLALSKEFSLIPKVKNKSELTSTCAINDDIEDSNFQHNQATTNNAITSFPLLSFQVESSNERERDRIIDKFLWFRYVVDFFSCYQEIKPSPFSDIKDLCSAQHYFCVNSGNIQRYPSSIDTSFNLPFDLETFERLGENKLFPIVLDSYTNYDCRIRGKLYNSLHFFSKALREADNVDKFLGYVVAIEAVCSIDNKNISTRLSNFVRKRAPDSEKEHMSELMKKVYSLRSRTVHEGYRFIGSDSARAAQTLAVLAIYGALEIYTGLLEKGTEVTWNDWKLSIAQA